MLDVAIAMCGALIVMTVMGIVIDLIGLIREARWTSK